MALKSQRLRHLVCVLAGVGAGLSASPSHAETRGYIVSWFATATNVVDFKANCPLDKNGGQVNLNVRQLMGIGYTKEEALQIVQDSGAQLTPEFTKRINVNAKLNDRPVPIFNYPEATEDPQIEMVTGKFAYGFDLSSKTAQKFEDPDTHQMIDNQLWRAVGCLDSFRAVPPGKPYPEELSWNLMIDSAPGWSLRLVGDDLSKDGKVTVILDRLTQHLQRDATGNVLSNATYIMESSKRSHNEFQAEIKNGMLTITPKDLYLEAEHPFYFDIALKNAHMRMQVTPEKIVGYWGGYLKWQDFAYMYTSRPANGADSIGMYHALKKMADADPDPKTGQNRLISGTYRMEAIPAFLADDSGKIVAVPGGGEESTVAANTGIKVAN